MFLSVCNDTWKIKWSKFSYIFSINFVYVQKKFKGCPEMRSWDHCCFVQNKNRHLLWDLVKHFRHEFAAFAFAENQDVDFQNVETSTK
jgi:hypothetical protein